MVRQREPLLRQRTISEQLPPRTEIVMVIPSEPLPVRLTILEIPPLPIVTDMAIRLDQVDQIRTTLVQPGLTTTILMEIPLVHLEVILTTLERQELLMRILTATLGDHRRHLPITLAPQTLSTIAITPVTTSGRGKCNTQWIIRRLEGCLIICALEVSCRISPYLATTQMVLTSIGLVVMQAQ